MICLVRGVVSTFFMITFLLFIDKKKAADAKKKRKQTELNVNMHAMGLERIILPDIAMVFYTARTLGNAPSCILFCSTINSLVTSCAIPGDVRIDHPISIVDLGGGFSDAVWIGMSITIGANGLVTKRRDSMYDFVNKQDPPPLS